MSLRDVMGADAPIFFNRDEFAEEAEYNGLPVEVILETGQDRQSGNTFESTGQAARATCWIQAQDVERPEPLDKLVINEIEWQVARVLESNNGIHCLELIGREVVW